MRASLAVLLALALATCRKNIPLPDVTAPRDEATVARGAYLGTTLCSCVTCHSPRDWSKWSGPADLAHAMSGGENVGPLDGLGAGSVLHPPNLTPHRLSNWTDAELVRAITTGMGRGNHALFPAMPYVEYRALALDDALAIVAWLRTLEPVATETPPRALPFPLELVVNAIPKPVVLRERAPHPDDADYGEYVTHIAGCVWCHTEVDGRGTMVAGRQFAGGHAFTMRAPANGEVFSANLTPDPETGLGKVSKQDFLARFHGVDPATLPPGAPNSVMMWSQYHRVSDQDLGAIYDYLRTLPPQVHQVTKFQLNE